MVTTVLLDIRMKWLELVADAWEVGIYRCRLDMVSHINSVEAESIRSWIDREAVRPAEGKIRIECWAVCSSGWGINCTTKCKCSSMFEVLMAPSSSLWLPGARMSSCHNLSTPSINWGGMKWYICIVGMWYWRMSYHKCESALATMLSSPGMWKTWSLMLNLSSSLTTVMRRGLYRGWPHRLLNILTVLALLVYTASCEPGQIRRLWTAQ